MLGKVIPKADALPRWLLRATTAGIVFEFSAWSVLRTMVFVMASAIACTGLAR